MAPMGQTYVQFPHATHLSELILISDSLLEFCHGRAARVYSRGEDGGDAAGGAGLTMKGTVQP